MPIDLPLLLTESPDLGDKLVIAAAADLINRTGATRVEVGDDAGEWFASARFPNGHRLIVERFPGPASALDALARHVITGGRCKCGGLVAVEDAPAVEHDADLIDGTRVTAERGVCRWRRYSNLWVAGCDAPLSDPSWQPMDVLARPPAGVDEWSSNRLARALHDAGAPEHLVAMASAGYWHTYRSPHELPEAALLGALTVHAVHGFAARVIGGEFLADQMERRPGQVPLFTLVDLVDQDPSVLGA
jgi:hypothetical protein